MEPILCMPDARHNRFVCIAAFSFSQCSIARATAAASANSKTTKKRDFYTQRQSPPVVRSGGLFWIRCSLLLLLRSLLARWFQRAGIVDLRDLMIAEAENLPKNFIGVFPEQRRARHLRRAVGQFDRI